MATFCRGQGGQKWKEAGYYSDVTSSHISIAFQVSTVDLHVNFDENERFHVVFCWQDANEVRRKWCIAKPSTPDIRLEKHIQYVCIDQKYHQIDCSIIKSGGCDSTLLTRSHMHWWSWTSISKKMDSWPIPAHSVALEWFLVSSHTKIDW